MNDPREQALTYLHQHQVMTLATTSASDLWAAAVFYVNLDFDLFFLSAAHTRHALHLAAIPWVAATIQEDYASWQDIKGLQLEGPVSLLKGDARAQAVVLYREKYLFIDKPGNKMRLMLGKVNWYRLSPQKLYFIDNSKGLGHRDEIPL